MLDEYPGIYRDKIGNEAVVIRNDGQELSMMLRGVEFAGRDIMGMEPLDKDERAELASFTFSRYSNASADLCACTIDYELPMPISVQGWRTKARLVVHVEMGEPAERGMLDYEFTAVDIDR